MYVVGEHDIAIHAYMHIANNLEEWCGVGLTDRQSRCPRFEFKYFYFILIIL